MNGVKNLVILVTNDDGFQADGIRILGKTLEKDYELIIAAPEDQKSACGHSITLTRPLIAREVSLEGVKSKGYAINGTPADCVRLGIEKLYHKPIDLVVSGINEGLNIGTEILYSGTVSAAVEAAMNMLPAFAVSTNPENGIEQYSIAAKVIKKIIDQRIHLRMKKEVVMNINVPKVQSENEIMGIKACTIGSRRYTNYFIERKMENNEISYTVQGELIEDEEENTDSYFINQKYVTMTPLHYDFTNYELLHWVGKQVTP